MAKRGETREVILKAAARVFSENGFEKTSVKMILEEANVVTGSFYHFFPSKEALFEEVVEGFLKDYSLRVRTIFEADNLSIGQMIDLFFVELADSSETYYNVLQADKLHWTVKCALHDMTVESMVDPMTHALSRMIREGTVKSMLDVDTGTLAGILIKGTEAVIHSCKGEEKTRYDSEEIRRNLILFWKRIIEF